jgi:hypothetical protein
MKRNTLLILLFYFTPLAFCQSFFPKNQIYYNVGVYWSAGPKANYRSQVDTLKFDSLASGFEYYSLNFEGYQHYGGANKYRAKDRMLFQKWDSVHWVKLYDFKLNAGDSIVNISDRFGADSFKIIIDSSFQINLRGRSCKVQFAHQKGGCGTMNRYSFIETIGSADAGINFYDKFCFEVGLINNGVCNDSSGLTWKFYKWGANWDRYESYRDTNDCETLQKLGSKKIVQAVNIEIYPNPGNEFLFVNAKSMGIATITDINGKTMRVLKIFPGQTKIDLSQIPSGVYLFNFKDSIATHKFKLIIQH